MIEKGKPILWDRAKAAIIGSKSGPSSGATIKADLDVYDGSTLQWFRWIGIFKAPVHNSKRSPDKKVAILCRHLKGDRLDVVSGLGGGESAYKMAMKRLDAFGRRDVMRAAHLNMQMHTDDWADL